MNLTPYHAKYIAHELTRRCASDSVERVVLLDEGFAGNDQLKANAVQIFKTKGGHEFQDGVKKITRSRGDAERKR